MSEWEDVKPARPAYVEHSVNITSSHIARATDRSDLFRDPVSLAMKEEVKADWCMSGWGYTTCGFPNNIRRSYSLWPDKAIQTFFKAWQAGKPIGPISFRYTLNGEVDKTPKPIKRKPTQNKSYAQIQSELKL